MKKFTAELCTVLLLIGAVLVPGAAAAGPALANTRAYCIVDADTGLVLAQQHRLQLLAPQGGVHGGGQQGKVCLQALGLGKGVVLPVGHKVIVLALA